MHFQKSPETTDAMLALKGSSSETTQSRMTNLLGIPCTLLKILWNEEGKKTKKCGITSRPFPRKGASRKSGWDTRLLVLGAKITN